MAKSRTLKLKGKATWAKVFPENRDMVGWKGPTGELEGTYVACEGAYSVNLTMDTDTAARLTAAGSEKQLKPTDDGLETKLIRKHISYGDWCSGPPKVTDADGKPWDLDIDGLIGNGSEVECEVEVYDLAKWGKSGTHFHAMKVLDLVTFEAREPEDDEVTV